MAAGGWLGGREDGLDTLERFTKATVFSTVVIAVAAGEYRGLGSETRAKSG